MAIGPREPHDALDHVSQAIFKTRTCDTDHFENRRIGLNCKEGRDSSLGVLFKGSR